MHTEAECTDYAYQVGASKFRTVSEKTPSISRHVHAHHHDSGRSGMMIMVGDTFHNFVDGILIAAAFMLDIQLGAVTAMAIIAHEIPQEVGDFLILLHSGYSKKQALLFNLFSAAASMLYVAVADLIPGLHKRTELKATLGQVLLIGLGISSIFLTKFFLE